MCVCIRHEKCALYAHKCVCVHVHVCASVNVHVRSLSDICIPLWSGLGQGPEWNAPLGNKQEIHTDRGSPPLSVVTGESVCAVTVMCLLC